MTSINSSEQSNQTTGPTTFLTVQALRAVAALMVVVFHSLEVWGDRIDAHAPFVDWENGAAGVDIFFVISGFVMIVAARRLVDMPEGWLTFLRHRVVRIVPLYWLLTSLKVAAVLLLPWLAMRTSMDFGFIAGSYLFLPVIDQAGNFRPLIPMGWTLTYEMLFYAIFAAALALRIDVLRVIVPGLGVIALLGLLRDASWPSWTILFSTIVLEFIFGVMLAKATLKGFRLSPRAALLTLAIGVIGVLALPMISANMRVVMWGIPAFGVVAGAVSLEPIVARRLPRWLLSLGDASYSIYLSHGFLIPVMVLIIGRTLPINIATQFVAISLCLFGSAALGWLLYGWVEHPMLKAIRRRKRSTDLAQSPAVAT